jgi:hypothetical protein
MTATNDHERARCKRAGATELRRIARTVLPPVDRRILVEIASGMEVEAAGLDAAAIAVAKRRRDVLHEAGQFPAGDGPADAVSEVPAVARC